MNRILLGLGLAGLVLTACSSGGGHSADGASGVTVEQLAGQWDFHEAGTVGDALAGLCAIEVVGVATIESTGAVKVAQFGTNSCAAPVLGTQTGTVTVQPDGAGMITWSDGDSRLFRVGRDLNTVVFGGGRDVYSVGIALRR